MVVLLLQKNRVNNNVDEKVLDGHHRGENNVDEETESEHPNGALFVTNTTLSILRLFGRYLHMMHLLKSISYDVAVGMSQLFEYYFYVVFVFFASENVSLHLCTLKSF